MIANPAISAGGFPGSGTGNQGVRRVVQDRPSRNLLRRAALSEDIHAKPQRPVLHGVNGSTLKATTALAMLNWLSIRPPYSRPRVSDDNAFVEALFKTAKYRPEFPAGGMASLDSKSLQPTGQVNHSTRKPFSPTPAELHLPPTPITQILHHQRRRHGKSRHGQCHGHL